MNKIRINQGRIVMWQFRVAGTLFVFFIGMLALSKLEEFPAITIFILISFLLPFLWSSYYVFEINPADKTISEYYWVAGFKMNNDITKYSEIEKIFVNPVRMAQNIHSYYTGSVRTTKNMEYHAFLKLADGNKFFLMSASTPEKIKEKLSSIAKKLNCRMEDNFQPAPEKS